MIEVNATLFTILVEASVGLLLFSTIGLLVAWRRKAKLRRALRDLVGHVEADNAGRLAQANAALGASGDDGEAPGGALHERERAVCQTFIDACAKRDGKLVASAYEELKGLVEAYQAQVGKADDAVPVEADVDLAARDKALRQLAHERDAVVQELAKARETVDKMMQEYTNMFGEGASATETTPADASQPAALEISDDPPTASPAPELAGTDDPDGSPAPASAVPDDPVAAAPREATEAGEVAHAGDAEQLAADLDEALAADIDAAVEQSTVQESSADEFDIALDDDQEPETTGDTVTPEAKAASA